MKDDAANVEIRPRRLRGSVLDETQDALGRALLDHQQGRPGPRLFLESEDGSIRPADLQPEDFFAPAEEWPWWERRSLASAQGAVLDLGAGAGRHSLHLQELGHQVTAVDASPGAVAVCRDRGISDVRLEDLMTLRTDAAWDTILLMGGNLGIAGAWEPTRTLLKRLASVASPDALLVGDSVDPTSDASSDVAYELRNEQAGFHRGYVRLRLRYRGLVTPWWDQLNIPRSEVEELVAGTGWTLEEQRGDEEGYAVVLRRS